MKRKLRRIAAWVGYPLFYLLCLAMFGYLTFPFDSLRGRIIAEFDKAQRRQVARRPGEEPMRLAIDELDSYWLSGVEVTGVTLTIPPKKERALPKRGGFGGFGGAAKKEDEGPKPPSTIVVDHATARVQLLPLLLGDVVVDFEGETLGGTVEGTIPVKGDGEVDVQFDGLQLAQVGPLEELLQGVPMSGFASGSVQLTPKEGSLAMADGSLSLTVEAVKLGKKVKNEESGEMEDVVEIQGIRVPSIVLGTLALQGTAVDGLLTIDRFGARGRDFELVGAGKIKLAEPLARSQADLMLKFKFTDVYRTASAAATSLLGKPGDAIPPLIEAGASPLKRAKTEDGYYRFALKGPVGKLKPKPAGNKKSATTTPRTKPRTRSPGMKSPPPPRPSSGRARRVAPNPRLKPRPTTREAKPASGDRASVLAKQRARARRRAGAADDEAGEEEPRDDEPLEDEPVDDAPVEHSAEAEDDAPEDEQGDEDGDLDADGAPPDDER